jgi:hypothetical protein
MKKINKEKIKNFFYNLFLKIIYLAILSAVLFALYKIIAWDKIYLKFFNRQNMATTTMSYNLPIQNKDKEISYEEEKYLNDIIKRFKKQEINIDHLDVIYPDAFLYKEDSDFYIKISFRNGIDRTWNNFVSVYLDPAFKRDFQNDINNIEYIDLRFSNKVFYKNKSDKKDESATSTQPLATSTTEIH